MDGIDPLAGKIGERRKVPFRREPARLEAAHLARRCSASRSSFAADNPAHRRIMAQPLGVVHILVSGKSSEHRLSQHSDESMPAVPTSACVGERIACNHGQAEHVIEFAIGQQSGIRGHHRAAKLEHHAAVEIEPENPIVRFTRRVRHGWSLNAQIRC